jgi:hypothetical protein
MEQKYGRHPDEEPPPTVYSEVSTFVCNCKGGGRVGIEGMQKYGAMYNRQ